MINLTFDQKTNIGLQYVLNLLSPCSPYGSDRVRRLKAYSRREVGALETELSNIEKLVNSFDKQKENISVISRVFMQTKDIKKSIKRCHDNVLGEVELFEMKCFLLHISGLYEVFGRFNRAVGLVGVAFADCTKALDILDPEHQRVPSFYISDKYSERLRTIRAQKREIENEVRKQSGKKISDDLMAKRLQITAAEEEEEANVRAEISSCLVPYLDDILSNTDSIGRLDLMLQKAELARRFSAVKPEISSDIVIFNEVYSPQIASVLRSSGKEFMPVSIKLGLGATVLTGANMGGKSVALKTITLNTMLMHLGFFCFAEKAVSPIFDSINIVSEDLQSIDKGLSSFGAEISQLKEVLGHTKQGFAFNILDEFARGTNPEEGAIIVGAVTEYLDAQRSVTLMTTHYDGISPMASYHYQVAGLKNIDMKMLKAEILEAGENSFELIAKHMDYRLLEADEETGCPRDALNICRLLSLDKEILQIIEKSY